MTNGLEHLRPVGTLRYSRFRGRGGGGGGGCPDNRQLVPGLGEITVMLAL